MKRGLFFVLMFFWTTAAAQEPACYKSAATHFFDDDTVVLQALSLHQVDESSWVPIVRTLQGQSKLAYRQAKQRAQSMPVNPLTPYDPVAAQKLLADTLFEIFRSVLNSYLVTNPSDIIEMFNYIQQNQKGWPACFTEAKKS